MKALLNYRYYVLAVIITVAIIGVFSEPAEELPTANWFYAFLLSKAIGFAAIYAAARLVKRWERRGAIPELTNTVNSIH